MGNGFLQIRPSGLVSHVGRAQVGLSVESKEMQHILPTFKMCLKIWCVTVAHATCCDDRPAYKCAFPEKRNYQWVSLLQPSQVSFPGGSYHMDTCSKLGDVKGKWPIADETFNFLLLSIVLFKQSRSSKRSDLYSGIYIFFYTPKQLNKNMKRKDIRKEKQNPTI